jgi:hypothetical protein
MLDVPQSRAFASPITRSRTSTVAEPDLVAEVKRIVAALPGVEHVLDRAEQRAIRARSCTSGELVALRTRTPGFTYYYWLDDRRARTSRAWSRSIASPATTRSSCFSIRRSVRPSSPIGWRSRRRALGFRR